MATKDELRLCMGKVPDWNGKPGVLHFTVDGEPQTLMVTPRTSNMQVGQMVAFRMIDEGTTSREVTDWKWNTVHRTTSSVEGVEYD